MINFEFEYELNRAWIEDEKGEAIGETNFVVPAEWLSDIYAEHFSEKYESFNNFLDCYVPEEDGEFIYQKAIADGAIIEDGTIEKGINKKEQKKSKGQER